MATAHKPPDGRRTKGPFELVRHYARPKRRRSVIELKAAKPPMKTGPLPDDFEPNEETLQAIRDVNAGVGVTTYKDASEMFADLGL